MGRGSNKKKASMLGCPIQRIDYGLDPSSTAASFVERVNFTTKNLHSVLEKGNKPSTVLLGAPQMGKSTLIKKYVKIFRKNYLHVIQVKAESLEELSQSFAELNDMVDKMTRKSTDSRKQRKGGKPDFVVGAGDVKIPGEEFSAVVNRTVLRATTRVNVSNFYEKLMNTDVGESEGSSALPSLFIFDNAKKLGSVAGSGKETIVQDEDSVIDFLPNFNRYKNSIRVLITSKTEVGWDEEFCRVRNLLPFNEEETLTLFFETLRFELDQSHKNRRLALKIYKWTRGNPAELQRELRYKSLILRYRTKILRELKEPEIIARALWTIQFIDSCQLKQLCKLRVREHKNAALFDMLLKSKASQINDIIDCVNQQTSGELRNLCRTISKRVSEDTPWDLHDAASERNVDHLTTLPLEDHVDDQKFWIKDGRTPLHLAVAGEDSKKALKFVAKLTERVSSCIDFRRRIIIRDTAWDTIMSLRQEYKGKTKKDIEKAIKEKLIGTLVTTYYNSRTYKITDIDFEMTPLSNFSCRKTATEIPYTQYYFNQYKVKIKDKNQPLLLGKLSTRAFSHGFPFFFRDNAVHLVPELCNIGQLREGRNSPTWFSKKWPTMSAFLDHRDHDGNTALHLASEHESVEIIKWLYDQQANIVIQNNSGVTPLEIMYEKAPGAIAYILDKALPLCEDHSTKGNLEFDVDFLAVLGYVEEDEEEIKDCPTRSHKCLPDTNTPTSKKSSQPEGCCCRVNIEPEEEYTEKFGDSASEAMLRSDSQSQSGSQKRENNGETPPPPFSFPTERRFRNSGNYSKDRVPREMSLLANMVLQSFEESSKIILSHVIVKAFLELKWKKLIWPNRIWTLFYIVLHFWFTWFIISVFIVSYPHGEKIHRSKLITDLPATNPHTNDTAKKMQGVLQYLIGVWDQEEETGSVQVHEWSSLHYFQAMAFIGFGALLSAIEVYEFFLIAHLRMVDRTRGTKNSNRNKFHNYPDTEESTEEEEESRLTPFRNWLGKLRSSLWVYLSNLENVFQLFFIFLMISVSTVVFQNYIPDFYYEAAAVSVVVAWTLILLQFGNFYEMGTYVQVFKTVLRSFFIVMGVYLVLILAFCISFSILFNKKQLFLTLPTSFFRALAMMAGELNYETIFDTEEAETPGLTDDLAFPFAKQLLLSCFTVIVTVILINLLIGLTVSDIEKIRGKSDVIFRSIQVERLYILENVMVHFFSCFINTDFMYVVPLSLNDMVIRQPVKNLPPRLQREIRLLLAQNEDRTSTSGG